MGEYDTSFGLILLGTFFNTYLYGIVCCQYVRYCNARVNDRLAFRILLVSVFLSDTAFSAIAIYGVWFLVVIHGGDPTVLQQGVWPLDITPIPTGWSSFVTQLFLTWRLWRLSSSRLLLGLFTLLAMCGVSFSTWLGIHIAASKWGVKHDAVAAIEIETQVTLWLTTTVVTDCGITSCLSIALFRARTGISRTDYLINQFIRGVIQTGVLAGIFSLGCLVTTISWPHSSWSLMFAIPTGRIYTTTLLYSLLLRANPKESHAQKRCRHESESASRAIPLTSAISFHESEASYSDIPMTIRRPHTLLEPTVSS